MMSYDKFQINSNWILACLKEIFALLEKESLKDIYDESVIINTYLSFSWRETNKKRVKLGFIKTFQ